MRAMAREGGNPAILGYKKDFYRDKVRPKWELIMAFCRQGLTDPQIALKLGIATQTWKKFLEEHEELADWVTEGREFAQAQVENALFKRAIGFSYTEVTRERRQVPGEEGFEMVITKKVKKTVQGDVGAQQYWLEHRAPNAWTRNPAPGTDTEGINAKISSLATLLNNPVPVRAVGSEMV